MRNPIAAGRSAGAPATGHAAAVAMPPLLLGASCLLWGWHQGTLGWAIVAVVLIEAARLVGWRWDFDDRDFRRLADASWIGLLVLVLVQFAERGMTGIYGVLRWFPLVLLALLLGQLYSTRNAVKLSALFLSVRIALKRARIVEPGEIDMRLPFLVACLLAAAAGPERSRWVLPAEGVLIACLLWTNRPRAERRPARALFALALCVLTAMVGFGAVGAIRATLEPIVLDIMRERIAHWRDPFRSHTALGEIGQLKVSDRIVLRVESPPGMTAPRLLREASFTHFSNNVWLAGDTRLKPLEPQAGGTRWHLAPERTPFRLVTVSRRLIRDKALLALPRGAFRVEELPVEQLKGNRLGAYQVLNGPPLVRYRVRYASEVAGGSGPGPGDLVVPQRLAPVLGRTLRALAIEDGAPPQRAVDRLSAHFERNFGYSLTLRRPRILTHPIQTFLEESRSGHCELFATATVLLLRLAGVPARYATGYAVTEYSELEQAWLVRRRHAHAWASAWLDGRWVDVDTTPGHWAELEAEQAAWWQGGYDLFSYLIHAWSRWRLERVGTDDDSTVLLWLLVPLILLIGWRVYRSRRVSRDSPVSVGASAPQPPERGGDSEFYAIETALAQVVSPRARGQPLDRWLADLERQGRLPRADRVRRDLLALHYRLRFAPDGLSAAEREALVIGVREWLAGHRRARPAETGAGSAHSSKSGA